MKKIFEYIGILSLVCFSFFLTDKTASVVQEIDDIMVRIKREQDKYSQDGIDATINGKYIIPGIPKKSVDVEKSYIEMQKVGVYDSNYLVYNVEKPTQNLDKNLDKYIISGNSSKREVSIILNLKDYDLSSILKLLGATKVSFILSNDNIEKQIDSIGSALKLGNEFLISEEEKSKFLSLKQKLDTLNNPTKICYNSNQSEEFLSICKKNKYYSVTSEVITKNPLSKTKELLNPGVFLTFEVNKQFLTEFSAILSYIESRGYIIEPVSIHIKED